MALKTLTIACLLAVVLSTPSLDDQLQSQLNNVLDTLGKSEFFSAIEMSYLLPGSNDAVSFHAGNQGLNSTEPISNETYFGWGSITKEFTTSLLMRQERAGVLDLTSTLGSLVPEFFEHHDYDGLDIPELRQNDSDGLVLSWPEEWKSVMVYQLLNMTSGILDFSEALVALIQEGVIKEGPFEFISQPASMGDIVALAVLVTRDYPTLCQQHKFCFTPGSSWQYSNTDYIIAGLLAEKLYAQPLSTLFEQHVLNLVPEGQTVYFGHGILPQDVLGQMANAYSTAINPEVPIDVSKVPFTYFGPAGGLIGRTASMTHMLRELFTGEIDALSWGYFANPTTGALVTDIRTECQSGNGCYGLGVGAQYESQFGIVYSYVGEPLGFRSVYHYFPCYDFVISMSVNSANSDFLTISPPAQTLAETIFTALPDSFLTQNSQYCPQSGGSSSGFLAENMA